jgi:hypothetical protein
MSDGVTSIGGSRGGNITDTVASIGTITKDPEETFVKIDFSYQIRGVNWQNLLHLRVSEGQSGAERKAIEWGAICYNTRFHSKY